jgi:signal transduction histidine kinase
MIEAGLNHMATHTPFSDKRLAVPHATNTRLVETLELDRLLNLVLDTTIGLTRAERGFVVLVDEESGQPEVVAARNFNREDIPGPGIEFSWQIVAQTIRSGLPVLATNAIEDALFDEYSSVETFRLRSILCVPLRARGRQLGAIWVDNRFLVAAFGQEDVELLHAFANQAALAIDNARLFARTDSALQRRVEELSVLQQIDHQLHHSLDLPQILDLTLEWAVRLTNASGGSLGLLESGQGEAPHLVMRVGRGTHARPGAGPDSEHPAIVQVMAENRPILLRQSPAGHPSATALLVTPVPVGPPGEMRGMIVLESDHATAFDPEAQEIVARLADRAAVAIANSRLYQKAEEARRQQSDFIAVVTHELRAPMTAIMGYSDLLLSGAVGALSAEQREMLQVVMHNVEGMRVLVQDLSDLNRLEIGQLRLSYSQFDLRLLVQEVVQAHEAAFRKRRQPLYLKVGEAPVIITADRVRTGQIITNLLLNANKYTPEGGRVGVWVRLRQDEAQIRVVDTGIGIDYADQQKLFARFFRADSRQVRDQSGWGLGLSIVQMLTELQGGSVTVRSQPGRGTLCLVRLPLVPPNLTSLGPGSESADPDPRSPADFTPDSGARKPRQSRSPKAAPSSRSGRGPQSAAPAAHK